MPTVSIGLPVFNGENYLRSSVESILSQSFGDLEVVISDNASTDGTCDIIDSLAAEDDRVRWTRWDENRGAAPNYNHVFEQSSGRYFKWAAHDDILNPEFVRVCIDAHRAASRPLATVYPPTEFIDVAGVVTHRDLDTQHTDSTNPAGRAYQVLQRMSMAHAVFGLHDSRILGRTRLIGNFVSSDYVLLLELAMLGDIALLDTEPLFQRRVHPGMSRLANATTEDVLRWFDPSARSRLSEQNRLRVEYAKSPFVVDGLGILDRGACAAAVIAGFTASWVRAKRGRALR